MTLEGMEPCQAEMRAFPSGKAWAHGRSCRMWPGQKIDAAHPWTDGQPDVTGPPCRAGERRCKLQVIDGAMFHSPSCPTNPYERISVREYVGAGRGWRGNRW